MVIQQLDSLLERMSGFLQILGALVIELESLVAAAHVVVHHYLVGWVYFDLAQLG